MSQPILIGTRNSDKVREFKLMLAEKGRQFIDLNTFPDVRKIAETADSFRENARLKASGYALQFNYWTLADDSGLAVDALGGRPGVYSSRFAAMHGKGRGERANNRLLLEQLKQVAPKNRQARFICALALSDPTGKIVAEVEDSVEGQILFKPRGNKGFGYDSLFYIPTMQRTAAELETWDKCRISHRGKALEKMREHLTMVA